WGRLTVRLDPDSVTTEDIARIIAEAEWAAGTADVPWSRHGDHPSDREPVLTAGVSLASTAAALCLATAGAVVRVPGPPRLLNAAVALADAQPRVRRLLEARLGTSRADLLLTLAAASAQLVTRDAPGLLAEVGQRAALLSEAETRRRAFDAWSDQLHGVEGPAVVPAVEVQARPRPLPPGPLERTADEAASGALLAAAASVAGGRGLSGAADALLVGVPRAARVSREGFAGTLSTLLARRGVLPLDRAVWRRLDRVDVVLVDGAALRGTGTLVLEAVPVAEGWSLRKVWSQASLLLRETAAGRTAGAAQGSLRLQTESPQHPTSTDGPTWFTLLEDSRPVGRVLIGAELDPRADSLLATARRAGLRVVLAADASTTEVHVRADELVPAAESLEAVLRRLQVSGHVVAVVSRSAAAALAAADVAIGVAAPSEVPWTADLLTHGLEDVETLLAATRQAREVSERGRRLALSASILGGLLLVAGPRPGARLRAGSPVAAAALVGLGSGAWAARRAGRRPSADPVRLVPWHALDAEEVLERLPVMPDERGRPARGYLDAAPAPGRRLWQHLRPGIAVGMDLARHVRQELDDPLTPVLSLGAAASAVLGSPMDAVLVGSVMGVNALVSGLQHQRADRAIRDLLLGEGLRARRLSGPAARTIGYSPTAEDEVELVPAESLRAGDVVGLQSGDVVAADVRLLDVDELEVDESGLTGESVAVAKQVMATPGAELGERACMVFEGSTITAGRGRAVVVATGEVTQSGRAVAAVAGPPASAGVQNQLTALTDKALPLTLAGGAGVTLLGMLRGQRLRAAVADGVAVAVAAVPEGLPLVATVAQLAATRRLSRRGVLVRSSRTVEALGRVDTMCFDKTGTLTLGRLDLVHLADLDDEWTPGAAQGSPDARRLLRAAARACEQPGQAPPVHATDRAILGSAEAL
ncbi:MAG: cation-transporting P-type ATPase, partial [Frankiaceae bacterium]|nr:cation-transporting P-type ATPase [Frankiaceae bacterium]